jgi:hypothetical protein
MAHSAPGLVHFSHWAGTRGFGRVSLSPARTRLKPRVPTSRNGTDFAIADLCTWNPLQPIRNSLKKKDNKAEESRAIHHSFYLTTE